MNHKNLYSALIFAGLVPFVILGVAPLIDLYELPLIGNVKRSGALYALVIISFMAGVHWGVCISCNDKFDNTRICQLMLASNVYVLIPWLMYLLAGIGWCFYLSLIIGFSLILATDRKLYHKNCISEHYYRTRRLVTILVLTCLLLAAFN